MLCVPRLRYLSTSAGVLRGDATAEEATPPESGTGSSTGGEHPASEEYAFGTAVGYERTTAGSGKESKNGEDIELGPSIRRLRAASLLIKFLVSPSTLAAMPSVA
ncbi:hypothetical protein LTR17_020428 [Elasticomyces elasticus]|nr:hypothetical protein LTR17_020428 [Elasticomyces elasticus]